MTATAALTRCKSCRSGRPDDSAACPWCGLLQRGAPPPAPAAPPAGVVYVDASVRDGVAGLAVVGALGEFTRRVSTDSSMSAERWALEWAFAIAREQDRRDLVFRCDCVGVIKRFNGSPARRWVIEHVPRKLNRAHSLSVLARKRTLQPLEAVR